MHVLREGLYVIDRRRRKNAVAEIEDVSGAPARALEHVVGGREHAVEGRKQQGGIEIALDSAIVSDALPRFVERDAPVGADDIAACVAEILEDVAVPIRNEWWACQYRRWRRRFSACGGKPTRDSRPS